jgi:NAD(P)-dependent dehydrogenase (short-subunit alcohol dehydrogenase family)
LARKGITFSSALAIGVGAKLGWQNSAASLKAVRRTFDINFFGTLAVTQAMLPL